MYVPAKCPYNTSDRRTVQLLDGWTRSGAIDTKCSAPCRRRSSSCVWRPRWSSLTPTWTDPPVWKGKHQNNKDWLLVTKGKSLFGARDILQSPGIIKEKIKSTVRRYTKTVSAVCLPCWSYPTCIRTQHQRFLVFEVWWCLLIYWLWWPLLKGLLVRGPQGRRNVGNQVIRRPKEGGWNFPKPYLRH